MMFGRLFGRLFGICVYWFEIVGPKWSLPPFPSVNVKVPFWGKKRKIIVFMMSFCDFVYTLEKYATEEYGWQTENVPQTLSGISDVSEWSQRSKICAKRFQPKQKELLITFSKCVGCIIKDMSFYMYIVPPYFASAELYTFLIIPHRPIPKYA